MALLPRIFRIDQPATSVLLLVVVGLLILALIRSNYCEVKEPASIPELANKSSEPEKPKLSVQSQRPWAFYSSFDCKGPNWRICSQYFDFMLEMPYFSRDSELAAMINKYGSDKSLRHNSTILYEHLLFADLRYKSDLRIFELGLGSINTTVPSNMGPWGKPGASLRAWAEFFKDAWVYGGDIDEETLFETDRIKTGFVDQRNADSITELLDGFGITYDIIIDDGRHLPSANKIFLDTAFKYLKPSGIFVIEDVICEDYDWITEAPLLKHLSVKDYKGAILKIPSIGDIFDNCMAVITK